MLRLRRCPQDLYSVYNKHPLLDSLKKSTYKKFFIKPDRKLHGNNGLYYVQSSKLMHTSSCTFNEKDNTNEDAKQKKSINIRSKDVFSNIAKNAVIATKSQNSKKEGSKEDSMLWEALCNSREKSASTNEKLSVTSKRNIKPPMLGDDVDVMSIIKDIVKDIKEENKKQVKQDLVGRMHSIKNRRSYNYDSFAQDMKFDANTKPSETGSFLSSSTSDQFSGEARFDLQNGERLGIFTKKHGVQESSAQEELDPDSQKWSGMDWYKYLVDNYKEKFLSNIDKHFPRSSYDEMIQWTEQGKLWTFPINNEEGMEEEANTPFYKHVFLEDKLNEGNWCPKQGPIRIFMTSVITALSLNPYLSVKEKHEHIEWFREYFTERIETLKNLSLIDKVAISD